jgi:hypothetical protein
VTFVIFFLVVSYYSRVETHEWQNQKLLVFVCTRSQEINEKRLSHRIAKYLEGIGIGEIGRVQDLGEQLSMPSGHRRKMLFLNDCNASCVKLLTNGFHPNEFIYVDVSIHKSDKDFDMEEFYRGQISPYSQEINPEPPAQEGNDYAPHGQY